MAHRRKNLMTYQYHTFGSLETIICERRTMLRPVRQVMTGLKYHLIPNAKVGLDPEGFI
jgi:hypothetical protein